MLIHNPFDMELYHLFPSSPWEQLFAGSLPYPQDQYQDFKIRHHFVAQREIILTSDRLLTIRQQQFESVRTYKERFNKEAMNVPNLSDREHIQAYKQGLRSLSLTKVLATKNLLTIDHLLDAVHEFIKGEINVQSKRE